MDQISLDWGGQRRRYTVSQINASIRGVLAKSFDDIWVEGEISGAKPAASGHLYFTLKDSGAQLRCACFKNALRFLKFRPEDGLAIAARGRIDVYDPRGEYQLIVETMEPQGLGALQLAFEQLKKRLEAEGLFTAERKRPLPKMPRHIGIVTSPTGAVIQDMIQIIERRFRGLHLRLYPAQVQGAGSVEQVIEGIEYFSKSGWADVVIVCRGGGSLEDLWTFNEEAVARAIAACKVPVISAVGHETDFTIADFVADLRAPTPSAAAEIITSERGGLLRRLDSASGQIEKAIRVNMVRAAQRLDDFDSRARELVRRLESLRWRRWQNLAARLREYDPSLRLASARRRMVMASASVEQSVQRNLARKRRMLEPLVAGLAQMSPLRILERGYAIVESREGRILRSSKETAAGETIGVRLHKGTLQATVNGTEAG